MVFLNPNTSVTTIKVNGLTTPTKRQKLSEQVILKDMTLHFNIGSLKVHEWKTVSDVNISYKKA